MSSPRLALAVVSVLLAVAPTASIAQQTGTPTGGQSAPTGGREYGFSASVFAGAGGLKSVDLTDTGRSSGSSRVGFALTWRLNTPVTQLYASFNPYYNYVFVDDAFSNYGASAGLGWDHRTSPRRIWKVTGRFAAAPDQNIQRPRISDGLQDPELRQLVPRNGFMFLDISGGMDQDLTRNTDLSVTGRYASQRYNVYSVEEAEGTGSSDLVDQREGAVDVRWSINSSERNSWGVSAATDIYGLGDDPANPGQGATSGTRVAISGSFSRSLTAHQNLSIGTGMSVIGTDDQDSQSVPTLDVSWNWTGKTLASRVNLYRNQGIFVGSATAVNTNRLVGDLLWNGENRTVRGSAGYGLSRRAGDDRGSVDTRTRNFSVTYTQRARTWGWFATIFNYRQRSTSDFGSSVVSSGVGAGLSWLMTGAGT